MQSGEFALAAAAGVAVGAAAMYLLYRDPTAVKPTVAPSVKVAEHHDTHELQASKPLMPKEPVRKASAESPANSSSHLAAHHLSTWQEDENTFPEWPRAKGSRMNKVTNPMAIKRPDMNFLNPNEKVLGLILVNDSKASTRSHVLDGGAIRGNATRDIWWEPSKVKAALVTCGGLCPGLNDIIQGVTACLWNDYGVRDIVGMTGGYNGLSEPEKYTPITLTPEFVSEIHMKGGSILKAGRGGFDAIAICKTLKALKVDMLFVIGGDGTQFAGHLLYEEARNQSLAISVVGVPKSIDNDVLFVDRTFGFESAVEAAAVVIRNGWVEATSCAKGVGIIKLMGRDAGFVAAHAALACGLVDLCLVPEVEVELDDICAFVDATIAAKGHMVIVVAEGAAQKHVATGKKDASGHTVYGDIGVFMRDMLNKHLKPQGGRTFYIDPSYIIRSVPANPIDHIYCSRLANNAVHTAMRGYTGVCVGAIHNIIVIFKSKLIASGKKQLKLKSSTWQTCMQICAMPDKLTGMHLPAQKAY